MSLIYTNTCYMSFLTGWTSMVVLASVSVWKQHNMKLNKPRVQEPDSHQSVVGNVPSYQRKKRGHSWHSFWIHLTSFFSTHLYLNYSFWTASSFLLYSGWGSSLRDKWFGSHWKLLVSNPLLLCEIKQKCDVTAYIHYQHSHAYIQQLCKHGNKPVFFFNI